MQLRSTLLLALLAATPPAAAQVPAVSHGWHLGGGADVLWFGHVAVSAAAPGVAAEVRPAGRPALHLVVGRSAGPWSFSAEVGWAGGHVEAGNDVITIRDLTADATRYRLAAALGRRLARVGTGVVAVALAPTLDLWTVDGQSRVRGGAEGRLVLRVPLGPVELEHRIGLGLSGSPIEAADVGAVSEERRLRTLSVGLGLRSGF